MADVYRLVPLSKTPFLFALGWVSLRLRGARWRDVGLARPRSWPRTLAMRCGRNLVAPVVAHGVQDTVDLVLIFVGRYPGL